MPSEMDELDEAGKAPGGAAVKFAIAAGITHRVRANMAGRALSRNPDAGAQVARPAPDDPAGMEFPTAPRSGQEAPALSYDTPAADTGGEQERMARLLRAEAAELASPEAREARKQDLLAEGWEPGFVEGLMLADLSDRDAIQYENDQPPSNEPPTIDRNDRRFQVLSPERIAWDSPESREARKQEMLADGLDPEFVEGLMLADLSRAVPPEDVVQGHAAGAEQAPAAQRVQEQQLMLDLDVPGL